MNVKLAIVKLSMKSGAVVVLASAMNMGCIDPSGQWSLMCIAWAVLGSQDRIIRFSATNNNTDK
jgi:hypothetical protein